MITESFKEAFTDFNLERGATIGDLLSGDTCMACESCGELLSVLNDVDMSCVDSLTITCPSCDTEYVFNDRNEKIPVSRFEEGEHTLAWANFDKSWTIFLCTKCGLNSNVVKEDVPDKYVPYLELLTLGRARHTGCDQNV